MKERAIEVSNLKKYFKDVKAVDDISYSVEQGELFGFLGVNGAGKSTVINILCTLYKKDGGSVRVLGNEVGKDDEKIRQDIGMVHQENSLDELLTVKENLQIRGGLYGETKENLRENFDKVVKLLGLKDFLNRPYGTNPRSCFWTSRRRDLIRQRERRSGKQSLLCKKNLG